MRMILLSLLLAVQTAFGQLPQTKPIVNPCQDHDIPWGAGVKTLNEYARKADMIYYDMDEDAESNIMYVTYRGADFTRVYSFLYGQYVGYVTILLEANEVKLRNKTSEQVEIYMNDADNITGANSFSYHCKEQDLSVKLKQSDGGLMIVVTNKTASTAAMGKGKKS